MHLAGSQCVSVGALGHIFEPHVCLRQKAQMKHTLGRRSAASAVAFLEADSQADKEGMTVTTERVFWELFDRYFIVKVLFLFEEFGSFATVCHFFSCLAAVTTFSGQRAAVSH